MSKIIEDLSEIKETRENKYTAAVLSTSVASGFQETPASRDPAQVTMDRGLFNLGLACVVFMAAISLIVSVKAFQQIHRGHETLLKLSGVILKQEVRLEALANAIEGRSDFSEKRVGQIEGTLKSVREQAGKNSQDLTDLAVDVNLVQVEVEDLKSAQEALFSKMIEASPGTTN